MRMLRYFSAIFVDAFAITRPPQAEQDRAAIYITTLTLAVVLLLAAGTVLAFRLAAK